MPDPIVIAKRLKRAKLGIAVAAAWALATVLVFETPFGEELDFAVATKLDYAAREAVGRAPTLDPRLKIFGYDDRAVDQLQSPEIALTDWTALLEAMGRARPKAIFIDKMFTFIPQAEMRAVKALRETLRRLGNVSVGAFVHNALIPFRETLPLTRAEFRLETMTENRPSEAAWLAARGANVYGPHADLRDAFQTIGHLLFPRFGRIDPLIRVNDNTAVPFLALTAGGEIQVRRDGLTVGGQRVPLDRKGRLVVDFPTAETLFAGTFSLLPALNRARAGEALSTIAEGDIVLILPLLYTGNHDHVETAVGRVPGGFVPAAIINGLLKDAWITPVEARIPLTAAFAGLGAALGVAVGPALFWPLFLALASVAITGGLLAFAYLGLLLPWLMGVVALVGAGLTSHAFATGASARRLQRLKDTLKGAMPAAKLQDILSGRGQLSLEPSERVVTLMFLDIANFSVIAQQSPPKEIFHRLKTLLREVTKTIHAYGGTVDKTLGDGVLCFFGYGYDGKVTENQADQAIRCAVEIQKANVRRCLASAKAGEPMLPFRIGLNTGAVYIGDLGDEDRIDFTVIGNGVNYAQRLEAACDHHAVMMSGTTIDFATEFNVRQAGFSKRFIHVKHHDDLLEAIEFNPLHDAPELRAEVLKAYRQSMSLERKELRWPVGAPGRLGLATEFGAATLVDFSASGCCLRLDSYLAKGITFTLDLGTEDDALRQTLQGRGLASLRVEVRWGKAADGGFDHGVKFLNLSDDQLSTLFDLLRDAFAKNPASERAS